MIASMTGGDIVADVLVRQGVRFLFTLCGGHISPILVSAKARGIRVVDTRHEATAVFAADAVARLTGVPGVAAVTAGPGVTNTITALKNAQMAQSPLVLLGGARPAPAGAPPAVPAPEPDEARVLRAAALLSRAERPVLLIGSQALLSATEAGALADAVRALRVPVYLSGTARGLLGAGDPLQSRHKRKEALREATS
jgi:thiamine pyrophosphate-dependent acetolactate synthase large subunit-like protein